MRNGLVKIGEIENIPVLMIVSVTVGVVLPIMLYNIAERMGAWWLFTLKKPKEEPVRAPGNELPATTKVAVGN